MKSLMQLVCELIRDAYQSCSTSPAEGERDILTLQRRVEKEGISFVTITLPSFAKAFEKALDIGRVSPSTFPWFKTGKGRALPLFLGGLLDTVFDSKSGVVLDDPNVDAIFFIRSITRSCGKIKQECSPRRTRLAFRQFVECEKELAHVSATLPGSDNFRSFGRIADILWSNTLSSLNEKIENHDLRPKHGPGATAERISGNRKYEFDRWHTRLDAYFPYDTFAIPSVSAIGEYGPSKLLEPDAETPVRVISVPKTQATPRIIAIEPVCTQYTQQAILEVLVELLENHSNLGGSIGFTNQQTNRDLALAGSRSGKTATLDLSEASDRVAHVLVDRMLNSVPSLLGAINACRSTRADVPGEGIVSLTKFASMGSALCFPIEAMVFLTIVVDCWHRAYNIRPSISSIRKVCRKVRVYGDDIIVPVDMVEELIPYLESFGLKVNRNKSFWIGKFRESCGGDFYAGCDVTPTYLREVIPTSAPKAEVLASIVSTANQYYLKGCWRAAQFLRDTVERLLKRSLPFVSRDSAILGWISFTGRKSVHGWNKDLQTFKVFGLCLSSKKRANKLDSYGALLKFFLKRGSDPTPDVEHLNYSGRPVYVCTKRRWATIY